MKSRHKLIDTLTDGQSSTATDARSFCQFWPTSGDFAGSAADLVKKTAEFRWILFARAKFDAAGNVNGVGANYAYGFANVFGSEATGENDALRLCSNASEMPIAGCAGAAVLTRRERIQ